MRRPIDFQNDQKYYNFLNTLKDKRVIVSLHAFVRKLGLSAGVGTALTSLGYVKIVEKGKAEWICKDKVTIEDVRKIKDFIASKRGSRAVKKVVPTIIERSTTKPDYTFTEKDAINLLLNSKSSKYKIVKITEEIFE